MSQIPSNHVPRRISAGGCGRHRHSTQKCTEAGAPSSGFPTDLRRSDCLSESHQPRALRPRCNQDTTGSRHRRQARANCNSRSLRLFLYNAHILASRRRCALPKQDQGFAEPGALSSTSPADLPLPRTAFRESFVLLASRARRSGESPERCTHPRKGIQRSRKPQIARTGDWLNGRHVVVTGAGTGIGRAIAAARAGRRRAVQRT